MTQFLSVVQVCRCVQRRQSTKSRSMFLDIKNSLNPLILGPIGLVNLLVAKACGASRIAITGILCDDLIRVRISASKRHRIFLWCYNLA